MKTSRLKSFLSEAIRLFNQNPEFGVSWIGDELELLYNIQASEWKIIKNKLKARLKSRKNQLSLF